MFLSPVSICFYGVSGAEYSIFLGDRSPLAEKNPARHQRGGARLNR
jgi:hypothetical protein